MNLHVCNALNHLSLTAVPVAACFTIWPNGARWPSEPRWQLNVNLLGDGCVFNSQYIWWVYSFSETKVSNLSLTPKLCRLHNTAAAYYAQHEATRKIKWRVVISWQQSVCLILNWSCELDAKCTRNEFFPRPRPCRVKSTPIGLQFCICTPCRYCIAFSESRE